jgi:hypothetical protein
MREAVSVANSQYYCEMSSSSTAYVSSQKVEMD